MAKDIFKLNGLEGYIAQVEQAGRDVLAATEAAVNDGADVILAEMRRLVPVDSGNLKSHLNKRTETEGDKIIATVGVLDADAETARYGNVMEYGSSSVAARSYVRAAFTGKRRAALKAMRDALRGFAE